MDVFLFQEVAGGYRYNLQYKNGGFHQDSFNKKDVFNEINNVLGNGFQGYLTKSYSDTTEKNYVGNAMFVKRSLEQHDFSFELLGGNQHVEIEEQNHSKVGYTIQSLIVNKLRIFNTHIIKYDANELLSKRYFQQVKSLINKSSMNFVLGGDFNIDVKHPLIGNVFGEYKIPTKTYNVKNTLNRDLHRIFKGSGSEIQHSVDQFICSNNLDVIDCRIDLVNVSDHYPLLLSLHE